MVDAPASPIATQETVDIPGLVEFVAGTLPSGATVSGQSWGGFNVYGDEKSMKELRRIFHAEDRALSLQRIIVAEREVLSSAERRNEELEWEKHHWLGMAQRQLSELQDMAERYEALRTDNYALTRQVGEMREALEKIADLGEHRAANAPTYARAAIATSPPGISTTGGDGGTRTSQL